MNKKVTKTTKKNRNIGITWTVIDLHAKIFENRCESSRRDWSGNRNMLISKFPENTAVHHSLL